MKKILIIVNIIFCICFTNAQQDAQFTQYMYNMSVINPAYATARQGVFNLGAIHRIQWVDIDGAPTSTSVFGHTPISEKIEVGVSLLRDEIGNGWISENTITGDFAYVLNLGGNTKLSFGAKVGANMLDQSFNGTLPNGLPWQNDVAFSNLTDNTFLHLGAGTFLFSDKFYLGLSAPNFIPNKHLATTTDVRLGVDEVHYFLTSGYVFDLSNKLKFKPSFLVKHVEGSPLSIDGSGNFLINNKLELGASYRLDDSVSGLINFKITPELRIGYAYDYTLSELSTYNSGSHEVFLLWDLGLGNLLEGKKYEKSPRFF